MGYTTWGLTNGLVECTCRVCSVALETHDGSMDCTNQVPRMTIANDLQTYVTESLHPLN